MIKQKDEEVKVWQDKCDDKKAEYKKKIKTLKKELKKWKCNLEESKNKYKENLQDINTIRTEKEQLEE